MWSPESFQLLLCIHDHQNFCPCMSYMQTDQNVLFSMFGSSDMQKSSILSAHRANKHIQNSRPLLKLGSRLWDKNKKWLSSSSSRSYSMRNKSYQKSLKYWGCTLSSSSISCLKYCSSSGHLGWAYFMSRSISFILHSFQHWKHEQHTSDIKTM